MDNVQRQFARLDVMVDQGWADIRSVHEDVQRIAISGPEPTERDSLIVRKVMMHTVARLYHESAKILTLEEGY